MNRTKTAIARSGCKLVFRRSNEKLYLVDRKAWDKLGEEFTNFCKKWFLSKPASEEYRELREMVEKVNQKMARLLDQSETIDYEEFRDD